MGSRRRGWPWAAGILMAASTAGLATAQDSVPRSATKPPAVTETIEGTPSLSPYFPMPRQTTSQARHGAPATAGGELPSAAPAGVPAAAPAAGSAVSQSSCTFLADRSSCGAGGKPSCWGRLRHCLQDGFLGYCEEFAAPPLGYFVFLHGQTQVANAEAARMVLYHYDFVDGSDQLSPRGRYQLAKISALLPQNFNPLIIEATPEAPALDEARRVAVVRELAVGPFPVPAERVVIGRPLAVPLQGTEAERIYRNLLLNTESGGLRATAGGGTTGPALGTTSSGVLAPAVTTPGR